MATQATVPLHRVAIETLSRALQSTHDTLTKAKSAPNLDQASIPQLRLIGDMNPLSFQVQTVVNSARTIYDRLTHASPPQTSAASNANWDNFPEDITVDGLLAKISAAQDLIRGVTEEQVEAAVAAAAAEKADRPFTVEYKDPLPNFSFDSGELVLYFVLPNLYFHMNMMYAILRKEGVDVGKRDYIMPFLAGHLVE